MYKLKYIGDVLKGKESKETKDKIEVVEGKKYSLYFLFDGEKNDKNANRAIAAASKFIKNNYSYYQNESLIDLKTLIVDANRKVLELKLKETGVGLTALCVPRKEEDRAFFACVGKLAVYSLSYNQLKRINNKNVEKILGRKDLKKNDVIIMDIKNVKSPMFICNNGFMEILLNKRKDVVKILNQKDMLSTRASMIRIMKARNFSDLAYLFVRR